MLGLLGAFCLSRDGNFPGGAMVSKLTTVLWSVTEIPLGGAGSAPPEVLTSPRLTHTSILLGARDLIVTF